MLGRMLSCVSSRPGYADASIIAFSKQFEEAVTQIGIQDNDREDILACTKKIKETRVNNAGIEVTRLQKRKELIEQELQKIEMQLRIKRSRLEAATEYDK